MYDDGIIDINTPLADEFGFTSDKFSGYLWKNGGIIIISLITSLQPGRGHFSELLKAIESRGFQVAVPTPLGKMAAILQKKGFCPMMIEDAEMGMVELWMRQPLQRSKDG